METLDLYTSAYARYESGLYEDAAEIFTKLTLLDPQESLYWKGLASAKQMSKKYQAALYAWGVVVLLCEEDPLPHFHAAECLLSLEKKEEAKKALASATRLKIEDPVLENRIGLLQEVVNG